MDHHHRYESHNLVRVQFHHLLQLLEGFIVPSRCLEICMQIHVSPYVERVLFNCALCQLDRLFRMATQV